jgi:hypothetical protein
LLSKILICDMSAEIFCQKYKYIILNYFSSQKSEAPVTLRDFWRDKPQNLQLEKQPDSFNCVLNVIRHQIFEITFHERHRRRGFLVESIKLISLDIFDKFFHRHLCHTWYSILKNLVPGTMQNTIKWICKLLLCKML